MEEIARFFGPSAVGSALGYVPMAVESLKTEALLGTMELVDLVLSSGHTCVS
jgi:hypothetical protein